MYTKDDSLPYYKGHWLNKNSGIKVFFRMYNYGSGMELTLGTFESLYPHLELVSIENITNY